MVEEILSMTFPMFKDQNAMFGSQMFNMPQHVSAAANRQRAAADNFWTDQLVKSFLKMSGIRNTDYDDYFKVG